MIFWSTIAGPVFNPDNSMVADKTGTAPVPAAAGPEGRAPSRAAGASASRRTSTRRRRRPPGCALTWITNKAVNKYEIEKYQIDASRTSAFNDPELREEVPVSDGLADGDRRPPKSSRPRCIPEFFQLNDIMNVEFNKALIGGQDAKTACANVQAQWEDVLRKAGHLA